MVSPFVVLVINDNIYGLMLALRYSYRSCPWERLEFMCWTLEAYMVKCGLEKKIERTFMFISKPSYILREEDEVQVQYDPSRKISFN